MYTHREGGPLGDKQSLIGWIATKQGRHRLRKTLREGYRFITRHQPLCIAAILFTVVVFILFVTLSRQTQDSEVPLLKEDVRLMGVPAAFAGDAPSNLQISSRDDAVSVSVSPGNSEHSRPVAASSSLFANLNHGKQAFVKEIATLAIHADDSVMQDTSELVSPVARELARKTIGPDLVRPDKDHLHGVYGRREDGTALWTPKPLRMKMTHEQKVEAHTGYCFNTRVSASLPLDRPVPDYNSARCLSDVFPENLPPASVIIVFHNEDFSALLRSFHSVLDRTPPHLLREVILVDDYSNKTTHPWLGDELDHYLLRVPKVVLRRLPERHGLMTARMAGVEWARAPVITFLDSHIETTPRWLEPMIAAVHKDPKDIVVPFIHTIDADSLNFERGALNVLGFSWSLGQTHPPRPESTYEPMKSPVMAGGLFTANKAWFLELGGYDPEMRLYGGEEMEIGFKTWMCGGSLHALPCSRVGHIFRTGKYWSHQVYKVPGEEIHRNKLRAAAVWMDEYEKIAKLAISPLPSSMDLGPLDAVKAVRERLHCRSFKWYLENVFPDLKVPKLEGGKAGALRVPEVNACLDSLSLKSAGESVGAYPCHGQHGTQAFLHDADGRLFLIDHDFRFCVRPGTDSTWFLQKGAPSAVTATTRCEPHVWTYDTKTQQLSIEVDGQQQCLGVAVEPSPKSPYTLQVGPCTDSKLQKFVYDEAFVK